MYTQLKEKKSKKKEKRRKSGDSEMEGKNLRDVRTGSLPVDSQLESRVNEGTPIASTSTAEAQVEAPLSTEKKLHVKDALKKATDFLVSPIRHRSKSKSPRRESKSPSTSKQKMPPSESEIEERRCLLEYAEDIATHPSSPTRARKSRELRRSRRLYRTVADPAGPKKWTDAVCLPESLMDTSDSSARSLSTSRSSFSESASITRDIEKLAVPSTSAEGDGKASTSELKRNESDLSAESDSNVKEGNSDKSKKAIKKMKKIKRKKK